MSGHSPYAWGGGKNSPNRQNPPRNVLGGDSENWRQRQRGENEDDSLSGPGNQPHHPKRLQISRRSTENAQNNRKLGENAKNSPDKGKNDYGPGLPSWRTIGENDQFCEENSPPPLITMDGLVR